MRGLIHGVQDDVCLQIHKTPHPKNEAAPAVFPESPIKLRKFRSKVHQPKLVIAQ